ncbi:rab-GTPase-TBC domain-containing protein [Gymnopilus junonius]|uniref:Rab-GTPase-TBC domain-containing protein n=1 Tax=Gymnopilus junonius TaxID=109634 RepID=A0A9P5TQ21_GYMJU|nr:rab-GTPase-TBC domain-containing protein [Gymnopilus junonius]
MSSSQLNTLNLPPAVTAVEEPDPLEALRSPELDHTFGLTTEKSERESIAISEFNDIALDDDSFSPIALTARPVITSGAESSSQDASTIRPRSASTNSTSSTGVDLSSAKLHRRTVSTTTIRSAHEPPTVSLLTNRLDIQENGAKSRGSVDGHLKLQKEFARLHEKDSRDQYNGEKAIDWDFWGAVISDYRSFASERPEELAHAIQKGIPAALRGMMWQHMAASKDPELEATYLRLLKETSTHEKAITRDLGRTFPHHDFFTDGQGIGQENLFNVLKAYSLYDPQVGYCQGLPFIVAILLLNMPDEEAFSLLVRMMTVYDLQGHFLPEMPKLQMRLFQFDRLVEELLPVLHVHFLRQGVKSSMFCSQWFLTLFSYRQDSCPFPLEIVFRIYDNCLANGIEAIFGFSIMLLKKNEEVLLSLKFDEILSFLNAKLFDCYLVCGLSFSTAWYSLVEPEDGLLGQTPKYRVDEFVTEATSLRITPFMLDCYRHEYEDLVRETNKNAMLIDELRNSNRALSNQVKTLENSLAQLDVEHVEVLNELVKQRLKNEEMEQELVRYKLLYAEAMHQNEGANTSNRISLAQMMQSLKRGSNG